MPCSDSSSSGGSDSEEDDKNAGGRHDAVAPSVPGSKIADLKRLAVRRVKAMLRDALVASPPCGRTQKAALCVYVYVCVCKTSKFET